MVPIGIRLWMELGSLLGIKSFKKNKQEVYDSFRKKQGTRNKGIS